MEYDNVEIAGVDTNTPAVAVDISLNKIAGIYPETFEEELVEDENPNAKMIPLPQTPPHEEADAILPKLEHNTTSHIET